MLAILLDFLDDAQSMQPQRRENCQGQGIQLDEPGKEPFGPACRDYFWVLCRLVESLQVKEETAQFVDIESLAHRLCCGISTRQVTQDFFYVSSQLCANYSCKQKLMKLFSKIKKCKISILVAESFDFYISFKSFLNRTGYLSTHY